MTSPQPPEVTQLLTAIRAGCTTKQVALGDGQKPDVDGDDQAYIVAWLDAGVAGAHTLAAPRARRTITGVFHCTGRSPDSARYAFAVLRDVVLALPVLPVPAIVGRRLQLPEQLQARPLTRDDDKKPPLFTAIAEWRFRTTPTTP